MGDPRKQRRKYDRPQHLWKAERILEEHELCKKYGLKNMKEVWKAKSKIKRIREQARKLLGLSDEKTDKEVKALIAKLARLGIIEATSVEDVLGLKVENLLDRRLQTMVHRKNLCSTINQARQFVVHKHVLVGDHIVGVPGYIVPKDEEELIKLDDRIKVIYVDEGKQRKETAAVTPEEGKAVEGQQEA